MTLAHATYSTVQVYTELVPPQPGKVIRVVKVLFTSWSAARLMLVSDPGGDPVVLTPPMHGGGGGPLVLRLGRSAALATDRGKGLGFSVSFQSLSGEYSVAVWYEVVT